MDAKAPLHALGGLQVEVPSGRTAARKRGDIADVGGHRRRKALPQKERRGSRLVRGEYLLEGEREILVDLLARVELLDERHAKAGAENGLAIVGQHVRDA